MIDYSSLVSEGLKGRRGFDEWMGYLSRLNAFKERQKALMQELGRKHKGLAPYELAARVLPILRHEGLCEGLPDYVVNGY